jgi:hypothetical protein
MHPSWHFLEDARKPRKLVSRWPVIQFVPRRKHLISVIKNNQLMMYREIIAVCSEIQTKHTTTFRGQNVEFVNVKHLVHEETTALYKVN